MQGCLCIFLFTVHKKEQISNQRKTVKGTEVWVSFFFPILMKEKEPAQLDISHHKILVWFLQVAEVKDLAMQSLGIQRKKLVRCSFTSSNSNGEWVKFSRFIFCLILSFFCNLECYHIIGKHWPKYTNWKGCCWAPLCLLGMLLTCKSCPFLFFFFSRTIISSPSKYAFIACIWN